MELDRQRLQLVVSIWMQYLFWPAGGVDTGQAGWVKKATLVEPEADEVSRAVGGRAHEQTTGRDAVVHLQQDKVCIISNAF